MTHAEGLPPLREVIGRFGLGAKKSLGQNFLLDLNLTRRIARTASIESGSRILEIGPGPGGLTRALLELGHEVITIERDPRFQPALEEIAAAYPGRLRLIAADALDFDEAQLAGGSRLPVVANLPYNIGTLLALKWMTTDEWPPWWSSLTLLFQREVARRLTARPNSKDYGRISVLARWRCEARTMFDIKPEAFVPQPKVTSTLVRIEPLAFPRAPADLRDLSAILGSAFGQRRKMLRQSLKSLGVPVDALLGGAGIDPTLRPESLDIDGFCALARCYHDLQQCRPPTRRTP